MTNTTTHNNPHHDPHLCISPDAVLEAPGPITQGLHRSHSNPGDNPTAEIHHCKLLRHTAVGKRGLQHTPQFLLSTPKHVYASTQDGRWTSEIYLTASAPAGSSPAQNKDVSCMNTMPIPLHTAPLLLNHKLLGRKKGSQQCLPKGLMHNFTRHLQLGEPQVSHLLFSYQTTTKLTLNIPWLPTRAHSPFPPPSSVQCKINLFLHHLCWKSGSLLEQHM